MKKQNKKRNFVETLQKPAHPNVSMVVLVGMVLLTVILLLTTYARYNSAPMQPEVAYSTPTPTLTPTPVDTSTWKTYTDWKYGYSVKLPPEFYSEIPSKGKTGDRIDPDGTGFSEFVDGTVSGDYPNRTARYGFTVRIEPGTPNGSNCTTDQECLNLMKKGSGLARVMPLKARILNRDVEGIARIDTSPNSSSPTGEDLSVYYEYPFIVNGSVFHVEAYFYYPKNFQETQTKASVLNAILSSITFPGQ